MAIQLFVFPNEAVQMFNHFAIESKTKALLIDREKVEIGEPDSKIFEHIAKRRGGFYLVRGTEVIENGILGLSPRDDDNITVRLGWECEEDNGTRVLTLSQIYTNSRSLSAKFRAWFRKYCNKNEIQAGVYGTGFPFDKGRLYNDIYYSKEARVFLENKGEWKQVIDAPTVWFPSDMPLSDYLQR